MWGKNIIWESACHYFCCQPQPLTSPCMKNVIKLFQYFFIILKNLALIGNVANWQTIIYLTVTALLSSPLFYGSRQTLHLANSLISQFNFFTSITTYIMDLTIKERKTLNTYGAHIYISPQSDKLEFSEGKIILLPRYIWDVFFIFTFYT